MDVRVNCNSRFDPIDANMSDALRLFRRRRAKPPTLDGDNAAPHLLWRVCIIQVVTAFLLLCIALAPPLRYAWLIVWLAAYAWSSWESLTVLLDLFDKRAYIRENLKGVRGLVHVVDVWLTREIVVANLLFLVFLLPSNIAYERYIQGLDEFNGWALKDALLPAYANLFAFSVDISVTGATKGYTVAAPLLAYVLGWSSLVRTLNFVVVVVLGLAAANEVEMAVDNEK